MSFGEYSVLGVSSDASEEDIRKAYFRKIREHPPETDAEGFQLVRKAYETLRDPRARADHDSLAQHGEQISALSAEADALIEEEQYQQAMAPLKRILVLWSGADRARNQLGLCLLNLKQHAEAIKCLETLTQKTADVPIYWCNLGHAYAQKAESENSSSSYERARGCFQKAVELEPHNSQPYLNIGQTYLDQKVYAKALEWGEKAVQADGKASLDDLDSFFFMITVCILADRKSEIDRIVSRILEIVPNDADVKSYVGNRFAQLALQLLKVHAFDFASRCANHAVRFEADENKRGLAQVLERAQRAASTLPAMAEDSRIIPPLRICALFLFHNALDLEDDDTKAHFKKAIDALDNYTPSQIRTSVVTIKTHYTAFYEFATEFYEDLLKAVVQAEAARPAQAKSNGCFVVTATYGTPHAPVVELYREFRDTVLARYWLGRLSMAIYNRVGPPAARVVAASPGIKRVMARLLGWGAVWLRRVMGSRRG